MITYFLPGHGIFGGIKVAYQFVDALLALGIPARIASPGGRAESWFDSRAPVVDRDRAMNEGGRGFWVFSHPYDYEPLRRRTRALVYHCQGTDPLIDAFVGDPQLTVLTCWEQARDYCQKRGAHPINVGIGVSDCFFYRGDAKTTRSVVWMPRRGVDIAAEALGALESDRPLESRPMDGLHEQVVASTMRTSSVFLATSEGEHFGLPALEALAAGCLVVSVPVVGGTSYLMEAGAVMVEADGVTSALTRVIDDDGDIASARARMRGIATATSFTIQGMRAQLERSLHEHRWIE
jgi:hypothetical protein